MRSSSRPRWVPRWSPQLVRDRRNSLRIGWLKLPGFGGHHIFVQIAAWLIAAVFALRAIGDFRYVSFFKRIRDTRFARLDASFCLAGSLGLFRLLLMCPLPTRAQLSNAVLLFRRTQHCVDDGLLSSDL